MSGKALIAGVAMVKFSKPGKSEMYDVMGARAAALALADAGVAYGEVQQAYAGYVYGNTCSGQTALYSVGMTRIPIFNVNNACASGSSAIYLARQAILGGQVDVALAVGFEQMAAGALSVDTDRTPITWRLDAAVEAIRGWDDNAPQAPQYFGSAGAEYLEKYGGTNELFAKVSVKARSHAARNPYALFTEPLTVDQVLQSTPIFGPLTKLMCCPPTCGAAATVLVSEAYARRHGLTRLVEIAGMSLVTDGNDSFESGSVANVVGAGVARTASRQAYEEAGIGPDDADLVELHDCFSSNEIIAYEALGLCPEGESARFIADGDNTYGGRIVTNPSGGLLSKGHPLGATGPAQIAELTWHLRGDAGARQVPDARIGLQHNVGLGGAGVVSVLKRA
ncbi:thiolase C-terminal domain-containing protein [Fulvimonas soli]|uniref:propanoyl-CoA C-acyltransferase n=1 Tax=Fulvimonas soli TaxID=155197 RepID=A0A316IE54_9GAMM|nr:beta-ketoacyl synthase N-terminal-like domain-containing protein [Fulvimonas soli]PWK91917.1 acetyl-CoA acetyltransferase [Fulvimonas soli]TNY26044.1 lipid-transfer protein [Fulvimonas soli]